MTNHKGRTFAVLLAAAFALGIAPAAHTADAALTAGPGGVSMTLVTGDQVIMHGPHEVRVRPRQGRDGMRFRRHTDERGDLHVIPEDANEPVRAGRVDRRLFNVSALRRMGLDDAARRDIPLIVSNAPRTATTRTAVRELPSIGAAAIRVDKASTTALWADMSATTRTAAVGKMWLDGPVRTTLDRSTAQIGAPAAWRAGHSAKGTKVAVLDTGIDAGHPDLKDAVAEAKDFTDSPHGTDDRSGHGTHVASTITGNGKYTGVAPDARLLVGKVLDDNGDGTESRIIAGMEWAAAQGAKVVNMSLGGPGTDGTDPLSQAVNRLTEQTGALFVVSAGNSGPGERQLTTPGTADAALTVGAVDSQDELAPFSSRGPRLDNGLKPDIAAPGVDIVAARASNAAAENPVGDRHQRMSGTSMAAPHVAGAAAILAGQHPEWTAGRLKAALMNSAKPNAKLSVFAQGSGRVDVERAVRQPVHATPASIDNGIQRWPHSDDKPITKTVTYHNSGTEPVTLDLGTDVRDAAGNRAPAGMFTVQPRRLTIPAKGQAAAMVKTDTTVDGPAGVYGGVVVATGDGTSVRTPIGVTREEESYDLKLAFLDRQGRPTANNSSELVALDRPWMVTPQEPSGTHVLRVRKGSYFLAASIYDGPSTTQAFEPTLVVNKDTTLVLDARDGRPVGTTVDKRSAREFSVQIDVRRKTGWRQAVAGMTGASLQQVFVRPSTTSAPPGEFSFAADQRLAEPDGQGGFANSPYLYSVRITAQGRVPSRLTRTVATGELAAVRAEHAASADGKIGTREGAISAPLPFTLNEYYTPGVPWYGTFEQKSDAGAGSPELSLTAAPRVFAAGRTTVERWNAGPFGPAFTWDPGQSASREGDVLNVQIPLFGDQVAGHVGRSTATGSTTLYRRATVIGTSPEPGWAEFTVPAGRDEYRMRVEASREGVSRLSTKVIADWRFRSEHVPVDQPRDLPLLAARFAPPVDEHNRAAAGTLVSFPVVVQRNGSEQPIKPRRLSVEVSYDDGATWRPAGVVRSGGSATVILPHPAGAKFVSLKASVADSDGNEVDQTIIRAYELR